MRSVFVLIKFANRIGEEACLRSVGTRGGCGEEWGPGACPCGSVIRWVFVRGRSQTAPPRTSTRPPHPLPSSPCPYTTRTPPPSFPHSVGKLHQNRGGCS